MYFHFLLISLGLLLLLLLAIYYIDSSSFRSSSSAAALVVHPPSPPLATSMTPKRTFPKDAVCVFWTGGFDSSFRVCQLVIMQNKKVQPIYASAVIDNEPSNATRRHNMKQERDAMRRIREMIAFNFPTFSSLLLETYEIDEVGTVDEDIQRSMQALYEKQKMRRPVCQYLALAQITRSLQRDIEVAVEYAPEHSMMYRSIHTSLTCAPIRAGSGDVGRLLPFEQLEEKNLEIFRRFVFPTITLSKEKMAEIARQNGFLSMLKESFSCWYPVNGKACGMCIMCKERIL